MKKLNVFLVVLLVGSFCVWALPGAKRTTEVTTAAQQETAQISSEPATTSQTVSSETQTDYSNLLETLKKSNFIIGSEKIQDITDQVELVVSGIEAQQSVIGYQQSQIEALEKAQKRARFFADFGVAIGFKKNGVTYGATADMGLKFSKGFMLKLGTTYMVGEMKDFKSMQWNLQNLICTATIGWEW